MDQERIREYLLKERARLDHEVQDFSNDLAESLEEATEESPYDQHMAETAAATLEREIDLTLVENARSVMAQIDRALEKLGNGTYGLCDKCGREIGPGRLEIAPYATLCIDCKRREERIR